MICIYIENHREYGSPRIIDSLFTCVYLTTWEFIFKLWSFWWNNCDYSWNFWTLDAWESVKDFQGMEKHEQNISRVFSSPGLGHSNGKSHAIPLVHLNFPPMFTGIAIFRDLFIFCWMVQHPLHGNPRTASRDNTTHLDGESLKLATLAPSCHLLPLQSLLIDVDPPIHPGLICIYIYIY